MLDMVPIDKIQVKDKEKIEKIKIEEEEKQLD